MGRQKDICAGKEKTGWSHTAIIVDGATYEGVSQFGQSRGTCRF